MAPPSAPKPSFIPRGYSSLSEAIQRYGEVAMPAAMQDIAKAFKAEPGEFEGPSKRLEQEPETDWLFVLGIALRGFAKIAQAKTTWSQKMSEVALGFRHELFEGHIPIVIRTSNGRFVEVPKEVWGFDGAGHALNAGRVSWVIGTGEQRRIFEGECLVENRHLNKFLKRIASTNQQMAAAQIALPKPTAKSGVEVFNAMKTLVEAGPRLTRKGARNAIDRLIGRPTRWREFDRAWSQLAPPTWRMSGAPQKSQQR